MSNKQIVHANHPNATVAVVGDEVRITVLANTVTVVYDAGWPASRPSAETVIAVGHTTAPSWLTSADVWLEDVI